MGSVLMQGITNCIWQVNTIVLQYVVYYKSSEPAVINIKKPEYYELNLTSSGAVTQWGRAELNIVSPLSSRGR